MPRLSRVVGGGLVASLLTLTLVGCVGTPPEAGPDSDPAPVGPVPAPSAPLTLDRVFHIVSEEDASATMSFTPGTTPSTSGDDLASEEEYFTGNAGSPAQCAGVVSAPYLVSGHDTGARSDDPSALVGTFSEVDENRFGLIQVYARQFDDVATASGFFTELTATVGACPAYTLSDGDTVTVDAVPKGVTPLTGLPEKVTGVRYIEALRGSASTGVTIDFYQRDGVVISVYSELTSTSTITADDVAAISSQVATRLGVI